MLQDPSHARASEMPRRALEYAGADYVLPVSKIAPKLIELVNSRDVAMKRSSNNKNEKTSTNKAGSRKGARASEGEVRANEQVAYSEESNGKPSVFACPECSGVLWELKEERLLRYRCRVGHSYTADSLKKRAGRIRRKSSVGRDAVLGRKSCHDPPDDGLRQGPKKLRRTPEGPGRIRHQKCRDHPQHDLLGTVKLSGHLERAPFLYELNLGEPARVSTRRSLTLKREASFSIPSVKQPIQ
jgi:hypothetical protein